MERQIRKARMPDSDDGYDCEEDDIVEQNEIAMMEREVWGYDRKSKKGIISGDLENFEKIEQ